MKKIMKNTLAYSIVGFIALTACANKKNATTEVVSDQSKTEAVKTANTVKPAITNTSNLFEIPNDRSACEEPWGTDEAGNKQAFGYFQANYQSKDNNEAYKNWKILVNNAPCAHKNTYLIGEVILKNLINAEKDSVKKEALVADLNRNFRNDIQYFGDEDKKRLRWAKVLYQLAPNQYELINDNLETAIDRDKDTTESEVIIYYLNNAYNAFVAKNISDDQMFETYNKLADIVDANIETSESDSVENLRWKGLQTSLDQIIAKVGTCEDLIAKFKPEFAANSADAAWLNRAEKALRAKKCTKDKLYIDILEKLYSIDPSLDVAKRLANYFYGSGGNVSKGNEYMQKVINEEPSAYKRSDMYLQMSQKNNKSGNGGAAKTYLDKALSENSNNGNAIILKGSNLYRQAISCGTGLDKKVAAYIMMDYAQRAKADPRSAGQANRIYSKYSAYKPSKEDLFPYNKKFGESYTIKCVGYTTTLR